MQAVCISVVRGRRHTSADGFQVYGDGGSGTMDWGHALTPRRVVLWEDGPGVAEWMLGGHGCGAHLDGTRADGHLEGTHLLDERGYPGARVAFEAEPVVFGRFRYALVMDDAAGNADTDGAVVHEQVVNSDPPAADGLRPVEWDEASGQMTFAFEGSGRR